VTVERILEVRAEPAVVSKIRCEKKAFDSSVKARFAIHDLVLMFSALLGLFVVLFRDRILPPRFFGDGQHIKFLAQGVQDSFSDRSYGSVALLYRMLNLSTNETGAALFGFSAAILCVLLVRHRARDYPVNWNATLLAALTILLSAVFLGYYSKDVFVLPTTVLVLSTIGKRWQDVIVLAWITIYAFFFRNYWFLVAGLYLVNLVLLRSRHPRRNLFLGAVITLSAASLAIFVTTGASPDYFRSTVNMGRLDGVDAASLISPFVSLPEPMGGTLNNVITFTMLVIPLPLLKLGGLYYWAITALISSFWVLLVVSLRRSSAPRCSTKNQTYIRCIAIIASLLVTQSLFEPDYGSYLRHLTPLMPCFIYVAWMSLYEASPSNEEFSSASEKGFERHKVRI
jgi:hypothetical protein